ncbi:MAG: Uma2 family endonuclease [Blastocatellia bacterium]
MGAQLERYLISTDLYHQMIATGVLGEDERVELLEGELIKMSPIGPRHAGVVDRLNRLLNKKLRHEIVRVQNPVELSAFSEPQPDITILKQRDDFYTSGHPLPEDVFLAIEVADTTLATDRTQKIPAYARGGIGEVWLVDLIGDRIEVHSQPNQGIYQEVRIILRGQKVTSITIPQLILRADDILG